MQCSGAIVYSLFDDWGYSSSPVVRVFKKLKLGCVGFLSTRKRGAQGQGQGWGTSPFLQTPRSRLLLLQSGYDTRFEEGSPVCVRDILVVQSA